MEYNSTRKYGIKGKIHDKLSSPILNFEITRLRRNLKTQKKNFFRKMRVDNKTETDKQTHRKTRR